MSTQSNLPDLSTMETTARPTMAESPARESPETAPLPSSPASAAGSSEHLAGITVEEPAAGIGDAGGGLVEQGPATLTREQFHGTFCALFGLSANLSGLKSLDVSKDDGHAIAASGAIYDTALEVPWLRFLIEPSNVYVQRALAVGVFGFAKYQAVKAELDAKRAAAPKPATARPQTLGAVSELHAFAPEKAA